MRYATPFLHVVALLANIALLPQNLFQALGCLEADPVIIEALGKPLAEEFLKAKHREWYEYHSAVSPWELDHYLPEF